MIYATSTGRLTRDAELVMIQGASGEMPALKFAIATSVRKTSAENNTQFLECAMFGKGVDKLKAYMTKGRQVSLVGRIEMRKAEKDGAVRTYVSMAVDNLDLCGGAEQPKGEGGEQPKMPLTPDDFPDESPF